MFHTAGRPIRADVRSPSAPARRRLPRRRSDPDPPLALSPLVTIMQLSPPLLELTPLRPVDPGECEVQLLERLNDTRRDDEAREPFLVRRDDDPRSVRRRRVPDRVLVGVHVVRPARAP